MNDLLELAENNLVEVIELTKDAAENYARATASMIKKQSFSDMQVPKAEPFISVSSPMVKEAAQDSPIMRVMEEPVSIKMADEDVPFVPTSLLDIERFTVVLQLQLIMQRLSKYIEASAKARSNAAYITGLRASIEEISLQCKKKIELEKEWKACGEKLCLTDFHPKMIADQLTLLDARIYQELLLESLQSSEPGRDFAQESADLYRYVWAMVQFEVLSPKERSDRVKALNHWLCVINELGSVNSFNMFKAVADALTSPNVARAKGLREGLSADRDYELRKLKDRVSPKNNYRELRKEMDAYGSTEGSYMLPFVDVYLKDLSMLYSSKGIDSKLKREERNQEIDDIVKKLIMCQQDCKHFIETIEPDRITQHWLLTRPYKNSQELDNLAVSRSAGGGMFSPPSKTQSPKAPEIWDLGDEGTIMMQSLQSRIFRDIKTSSRGP